MENIFRVESISMLHEVLNHPPPSNPLVSVLDLSNFNSVLSGENLNGTKIAASFYSITVKHLKTGLLKYGRKQIDFQEGSLFCTAPRQVSTFENLVFDDVRYSWGLYFHSDLIHGTSLHSKIKDYNFLNYSIDEALHLSENEKLTLSSVVDSIRKEVNNSIDKHTKNVLVSGIELLLNHCLRFYDRQFITRETQNETVVEQVTNFLTNYFNSPQIQSGLPTALECANHVNLTPNYLSDLLKKQSGKTTQDHIHYHLLETAKDKLLSSDVSIKEIAYSLGFEHSHYFSSLFKKKVGVSPKEFRSLN